jgi:DNA polymerase III subunit delta
MPKLEPKTIQKELDQGELWPVYWIYGHEAMKARELLKRIRKAVTGQEEAGGSFAEEVFEGGESAAPAIVDSALTCPLGGGTKFVVVKDAHALKDADELAPLLGPRGKKASMPSVCVFLSKDLDGRKKFSKVLTEKAAVVPCEEVAESDREAWISYLAKRRGLAVSPELSSRLAALDPWTLDIVDQELEKFSLSGLSEDVVLGEAGPQGGTEAFLHFFFTRDLARTLERVEAFADRPDESLPLLGLMAWNVRQLASLVAERASGKRGGVKLNPYLAQKLEAWAKNWELDEILALQRKLAELDFDFKQTPLLPLGMWTDLVMSFGRLRS